MSRLAEQQRGALALMKNRPFDASGDNWLMLISQSKELVMLREIARWWRQYQVASLCRFTTLLLKRSGRFEETISQYFEQELTSPYIEEMARGFLRTLGAHGDELLSLVARTELALIDAKQGRRTDLDWDRHPDMVFAALESGGEMPARDDAFDYQLTIGTVLQCIRRRRVTVKE
jgi:hypothetical protein